MSVLATSPFCIKDGYRENPGPVYFLDDVHEREGDQAIVFQPDVLTRAAELAEANGLHRVTDIGCGQATKLAEVHEQHLDWDFIGVDYGDNLAWCREQYDWGTWVDIDVDVVPGRLTPTFPFHSVGAVVVASDIIEHLVDPRHMLTMIRETEPAFVLISTPERDLQYGTRHRGPSPNKCHVREWNRAELQAFLEREGFEVLDMGLTRSNNHAPTENTILAACR